MAQQLQTWRGSNSHNVVSDATFWIQTTPGRSDAMFVIVNDVAINDLLSAACQHTGMYPQHLETTGNTYTQQ